MSEEADFEINNEPDDHSYEEILEFSGSSGAAVYEATVEIAMYNYGLFTLTPDVLTGLEYYSLRGSLASVVTGTGSGTFHDEENFSAIFTSSPSVFGCKNST